MANEKLAAVGPIDPANGFPRWYEDASGLRLELGLDPNDQNIAALEVPPGPVVFPTNYPEEAFYFLAEAEVAVGGPGARGRAKLVLGLEATFAGAGKPIDGQQIVFGRTRVRIQNGRPGTEYTLTHPYGQVVETADDRGKLDVTVDVGVAPGHFTDALSSGVGPFLRWTSGADLGAGESEAPEGYVGSSATPHTVTGSPAGTNFFRVSGVGALTGSDVPETVETSLFSLQAKKATQIGAQVDRAVLPQSGSVDVFVTSAPGQELVVTGAGVPTTLMRGSGRSYVARVRTAAELVEVLNRTGGGGSAPTAVTDAVTVASAAYDLDSRTLTVEARTTSPGSQLTLEGFGALSEGAPTSFTTDAPPATIRVTSTGHGSAVSAVALSGAVTGSEPPTALIAVTTPAGIRTHVTPGEEVTVDSTGSTGALAGRTWTVSGGQIADATGAVTTLTLPQVPGSVTVTLSVTDVEGRTADTKADVTVEAPTAPLARPGADRTIDVGEPITLDAGANLGARTFRWTALDEGAVVIDGPDAVQPTVTLRRGGPTRLQLEVSGPGGSKDVAEIVLTGRAGTIAIDRAEYRADKKQWRVSGRATGPDPARRLPDLVEVNTPLGRLGEAAVDAAGAWSLVTGLVGPAPLAGDRVTAGSRRGGVAEAPLTVRQ